MWLPFSTFSGVELCKKIKIICIRECFFAHSFLFFFGFQYRPQEKAAIISKVMVSARHQAPKVREIVGTGPLSSSHVLRRFISRISTSIWKYVPRIPHTWNS